MKQTEREGQRGRGLISDITKLEGLYLEQYVYTKYGGSVIANFRPVHANQNR